MTVPREQRMMAWRRLVAGLLLMLFALPAWAQQPAAGPHVIRRLVAESDTPAAGGDVMLAIDSTPQPGWHSYWQNPGDAGFPAAFTWTLPAGASAGEVRYPVPERLLIAGLMNYVFERPHALLVPLHVPMGLKPGTPLPISVKISALVCTRELCVPEQATLATRLTVGDGAVTPERRARFDGWRAALPRPLGSPAAFEVANGRIRIGIPYPVGASAPAPYLYPLTDRAMAFAEPQVIGRNGDTLVIETKAAGSPTRLDAVLALGEGPGLTLAATPGAVPAVSTSGPAAGSILATAALAFLGAVLGGLLLNLMPCVFPILSLKALGLARSGASAAHARAEGVAYTAGVVLVCVALGGLLLALRATGASAGWAFQLQDPRVILVLLLLVSAIAFNLAGLYELPAPQFANRLAAGGGGAFATGALTAFVATPCTGPFMGVALGAALVLPWPAALGVFAGLGLGLALPFLLLGFVPALRRRLPKPGAWMETFRHVLSLPMFLTAVALAWVLGRQIGVDGLTLGLLLVLGLAVVLWALGRRQARGAGSGAAWPAVLAITLAGVWLVARYPAGASAAPAATPGAEPFSEARLATLRAQGKPVFAYFTADWCLTCKVNEKAAIETAAVGQAFRTAGVTTLVGDWTNGDAALGRFIEAHNRAGVPLYLWYAPGGGEPRVLPQLLTPGMLTALPADPRPS